MENDINVSLTSQTVKLPIVSVRCLNVSVILVLSHVVCKTHALLHSLFLLMIRHICLHKTTLQHGNASDQKQTLQQFMAWTSLPLSSLYLYIYIYKVLIFEA